MITDRHWTRDDYRAEIARLRADLESERQLSADYNEEIVAAHDDRDRYKAENERLRAILATVAPNPDDPAQVEAASTARIHVDTGFAYYEGPIGPDAARAVLTALAAMGGER